MVHSHQKERRYTGNLIQTHVTYLTVNCNIVVLYATCIPKLIKPFLIQKTTKTRPWDGWLLLPIYRAKYSLWEFYLQDDFDHDFLCAEVKEGFRIIDEGAEQRLVPCEVDNFNMQNKSRDTSYVRVIKQ